MQYDLYPIGKIVHAHWLHNVALQIVKGFIAGLQKKELDAFKDFGDYAHCWFSFTDEYNWLKDHPYKTDIIERAYEIMSYSKGVI